MLISAPYQTSAHVERPVPRKLTRRIALSPSRITAFDGERLSLSYLDYCDHHRKIMTLSAAELVRRFTLHILPRGFMRVRQYGFLANAVRAKRLKMIRVALKVVEDKVTIEVVETEPSHCYLCPKCQSREWHCVGITQPKRWDPG